MTQYTLQIPSVMARAVWHKFFDEFHTNPTKVVQQSTNGYPVTDIYTDDKQMIFIKTLIKQSSKLF